MDRKTMGQELIATGVVPVADHVPGTTAQHLAYLGTDEGQFRWLESTEKALTWRILAAKEEAERTIRVSASKAAKRAARRILATLYV